jgi:hypothetical protein
MVQKGVFYLRKTLLCLIFILLITSVASAQSQLTTTQTGQLYRNDAFKIEITFPISWNIKEHQGRPDYLTFSAYSPTHFPLISIISAPHQEAKPANTVTNKPQKNGNFDFKIEGQGDTIIAEKKAKWTLSSFTDHASFNTYTLMYFLITDNNDYVLTMQGNYTDYQTDRKVFDEIISTLNILP